MRGWVFTASAYLFLALVFTHPLILNFSTQVPGGEDVGLSLWQLWWFNKAVGGWMNPYWTDRIFYPGGVNMVFFMPSVLNLAAGTLLQVFLSTVEAYNTIVLASVVLSGYGMYLLARHLTGDNKASFVAGLIYGFSHYHIGEVMLGHLHTMSVQWLPFYVLFMLKNSMWSAVFLALTAYSSPTYYGFALMLAALYLTYRRWRTGETEWTIVKSAIVSLVLTTPIAYLMFSEMLASEYMNKGSAADIYSLDLLEAPGFIGYAALLLFLLHLRDEGVFKWVGEKAGEAKALLSNPRILAWTVSAPTVFYFIQPVRDPVLYAAAMASTLALITLARLTLDGVLGFWSIAFFAFTLLSFGPLLRIGGQPVFILPYIFLQHTPPFTIFRTPVRFTVLSMLALSAAAASVLKKLDHRMLLAVVAVVLLEYYPAMEFSRATAPGIYDGVGGVVVNVPAGPAEVLREGTVYTVYYPLALYYAAVSDAKTVDGYGTRVPEWTLQQMRDNPFIADVMHYRNSTPEEMCESLRGVDHVIVWWSEYDILFGGTAELKGKMEGLWCLEAGEEDGATVYSVV